MGITVDPTNGKVYWTDFTNRTVRRANLDGSATETIISTAEAGTMGAIYIDVTGGKIYYQQTIHSFDPFTIDHTFNRANLDGTGIETIITGLGEVSDIILVADS